MTHTTIRASLSVSLLLLLGWSGAAVAVGEVDPPRTQKQLSSGPADSTRSPEAQLRLEDITIEGEVDIPRVLFIESREHLRDQDFLHHLFLPSAAEVGAATPARRIIQRSPQGEHEPWTP